MFATDKKILGAALHGVKNKAFIVNLESVALIQAYKITHSHIIRHREISIRQCTVCNASTFYTTVAWILNKN